VLRAGGIFAAAFPLAILPSALAGPDGRAPAHRTPARTASEQVHLKYADSGGGGLVAGLRLVHTAGTRATRTCRPTSGSVGYVNPLTRARVTGERIDQGVDYTGSGTLAAIGDATVSYVATTGNGWPGSFIEYRLDDGPDAGCYVYYAEGVTPAGGLHVGEMVTAGQPIATIIRGWQTGIELGWAAGVSTMTYAAKTHQWSANSDQGSVASIPGKSFSALIVSLGGPPGRVEG
jgi:hypothetical protein